ncbi:MAG: ABC transporter ATP-binding protein [Candidatus Thorarchaeota archaeon]
MADDDYLEAADSTSDDTHDYDDVQFAVKLTDVSRVYTMGSNKIGALRNINLEIEPGQYVVVSGHSGSGKTTLLNVIGAIDVPSSGRLLVMDVPISDYDESFRATFRLTTTGFIFQSYNLVSTLTALENVMFPMQMYDKTPDEIEEVAMSLLARVKMDHRPDHLPWQLSSGEQQRVAIARAMANDPPIILADEPTANLDGESGQMIRELLSELNAEGKTVVVMTHDEGIIGHKNARRFTMENGELKSNV